MNPVIRDCLTLILFPFAACLLLAFVGVPNHDRASHCIHRPTSRTTPVVGPPLDSAGGGVGPPKMHLVYPIKKARAKILQKISHSRTQNHNSPTFVSRMKLQISDTSGVENEGD